MTYKAGAIIINLNQMDKILLIFRGKEQDWSFPKGHVEENEDYKDTLLREISEETGITNLVKISSLPDFTFEHPIKGQITTKMFLGFAHEEQSLKTEKDGDQLKWTAIKEVSKKLSYENLKNYFIENLPQINLHISEYDEQ
jgi:ADP-ribose pyrophosphatase YjhB (NUDIX family)